MSLATYIGCNIKVPLSDVDSNDLIIIGDCFSGVDEKLSVKESQLTTPYVYEVSSGWGIELTEYMSDEMRDESKRKLIELCNIMDYYLEKGDFFEMYSCWVGEEAMKRESELTLQLNNFDSEQLEIPEKTLVRFEK